ncbi:MAG: DUF2273 domain-containing protein [Eubacteriales bacterium]
MRKTIGIFGNKIDAFCEKAVEEYPGKFYGVLFGIFLALLFIAFDFWQTMLIIVFALIGYYIGKLWDDNNGVPSWLVKIEDVIRNIWKKLL